MNQENLKQVIDLMSTIKIGAIAINDYTNKQGEKTQRRINIGYSYRNALEDDVKTLNAGVLYIPSEKYSKADWDMALAELKQSSYDSLEREKNPDAENNNNRSKGQKDAYLVLTPENGAVMYNYNTQEIYIKGVQFGEKKIVEVGEQKVVNSAPKTIAKNVIRREYLKQGLIRTFKVNNISQVKLRGTELELN
jgi:hypothetical protein